MEMQLEVDGEEKQLEILHIDSDHYQFKIDNQLMITRLSYIEEGHIAITIDDHQYELFISNDGKGNGYASYEGFIFTISRTDVLLSHEEILGSFDQAAGGQGSIVSPMPGKVIKINVEKGQDVKKGETLLIVEAMKMENHIGAPSDGIIETINIKQGEMVEANIPLITLQSNTNQ